jgi:hypothetical protein
LPDIYTLDNLSVQTHKKPAVSERSAPAPPFSFGQTIVNVRNNLTLTIVLRKDAHGFAKEICGFSRANPAQQTSKVKITLSFAIIVLSVIRAQS